MKGVRMLVNIFHPLPVGGAERQAERLAAYLAFRNIPVGIITRRVGELPVYEKMGGFEVFRIREFGSARIRSMAFIMGAIFNLILHSDSFDILHAHLAFAPAMAACVAGRLLNKAVIIKFGNSGDFGDVQELMSTWRGRQMLFILSHWADAYIALTDEMEKEMHIVGFESSKIIRMVNGVDTNLFCPSEHKQTAKDAIGMAGKTIVLFTGRFASQKSLPMLIIAFEHVVRSLNHIHLFLVGKGDTQKTLEGMVVDLDITSHVTITQGGSNVQPYLNVADIFVLPSLGEGISNSLLEAMASGLACVATNVGGSAEVLAGGACGVLVSPNNVEQLADAIIHLVSNPNEMKRLGMLARQRVVDHYNLDAVGEQYIELYSRLAKG